MPIAVATLLTEIGAFLHDPGNGTVWPKDVRIGFINDAIRTIALLRPDAVAKTATVELVANTPRQTIPADGDRLLTVVRNINTGLPVRKISREALRDAAVSWAPSSITEIDHYMFDEENPKAFYVSPVPAAVLPVEVVYAATPAVVTEASVSLGIPDIYSAPVKDFVLSRCFGMETKGADYGKTAYYLQSFYNALGVKLQNDGVLRAIQADPTTRT